MTVTNLSLSRPTVLTIAGFDPSSGAGMTADLAVMGAHGLFGTACITALTVQSTVGVTATQPVDAAIVRATLETLEDDLPPAGIKIGMLATEAIVLVVAAYLERVRGRGVPVVLDPVIRSSSGRALLEPPGVQALCERILPLVDWVTPNLAELGVLAGVEVACREHLEPAAEVLRRRHARLGVVATGGHLQPPDDLVFGSGASPVWLAGERIESRSTHGTGCAFSTAMLCGLVHGLPPLEAAREAKAYVAEAIRRAEPRGRGNGPMELLWPLRP